MNGQMESYKDKQNIVDEYLSRTDIYASLKPLDFDLRGYASYIEENGIDCKNVPKDIVNQFVTDSTVQTQIA